MKSELLHLLKLRTILMLFIIVLLVLVGLEQVAFSASSKVLPSKDLTFILLSFSIPANIFFLYRYDSKLTKAVERLTINLETNREQNEKLNTKLTNLLAEHKIYTRDFSCVRSHYDTN